MKTYYVVRMVNADVEIFEADKNIWRYGNDGQLIIADIQIKDEEYPVAVFASGQWVKLVEYSDYRLSLEYPGMVVHVQTYVKGKV